MNSPFAWPDLLVNTKDYCVIAEVLENKLFYPLRGSQLKKLGIIQKHCLMARMQLASSG